MIEGNIVRPSAPIPPAPAPANKPPIPSTVPLPPSMRDLTFDLIDMFEEFPERFKMVSDTKQDMD